MTKVTTRATRAKGEHAMPEKNGNGLWRVIAIALVSFVLASAASWLAFGASTITRTEAVSIVREHSPYNEDRKLLNSTLESVSSTMKDQGVAINALSSAQAAQTEALKSMTAEQSRMNARLDKALEGP